MVVKIMNILHELVLQGRLDVATLSRNNDGFAICYSVMYQPKKWGDNILFTEETDDDKLWEAFTESIEKILVDTEDLS